MSLTRKACVSGPPCWPRATETIVASEHISVTTTVQAFGYVRIVGPPLSKESSSERIDDFTGSTHGTGAWWNEPTVRSCLPPATKPGSSALSVLTRGGDFYWVKT